MDFERKYYLDKLIERKDNKQIKLITGIRRCGKSHLLNEIFYRYLLGCGIKSDHIIKVAFDDYENEELLNIKNALAFLKSKIVDNDMYYFLLDEVQLMIDPNDKEDKTAFFKVLNSLMHVSNADIYASGSNSKLLSSDIESIFRGRCDSVRVHPLTFKEFFNACNLSKEEALDKYMIYGGLPHVYSFDSNASKAEYLKSTFDEIYKLDIAERYKIRNNIEFDELVNFISSQIGSIVSYQSLSNTYRSIKKKVITDKTIKKYLDFMINAYIINMSKRYNLKGKKYIDGKCKYYFEDLGLRNARLNFAQIEESHLMENLIYNELLSRGYNVDTGDVAIREKKGNDDTFIRKNLEVDFVANKNGKKYYIQSALDITNEEKFKQETKSLLNINDAYEKIIVVKNIYIPRTTSEGIKIISIYDFLLNDDIFS
ncbi:MAG: ATP-binding protein [Clostridia bacterium]|nr:ATP-binding protein [Clostridia bacterium]